SKSKLRFSRSNYMHHSQGRRFNKQHVVHSSQTKIRNTRGTSASTTLPKTVTCKRDSSQGNQEAGVRVRQRTQLQHVANRSPHFNHYRSSTNVVFRKRIIQPTTT